MKARQAEAGSVPARPALAGRRALVLGGSGGIGAAVALALASRGADLLIHGGRSGKALEASLAAARAAAPGQASIEGMLRPLTGPRDLDALLPGLGPVDILVCALGPFHQAPLHGTGPETWESLCLLNLALPGALASALLPAMREAQWGRFLFFGGTRTDAIRAYSTNAAYAAAKTGLGVLVKSLAAEYGGEGIGAFLLCPGFVDTEYLSPELRRSLAAKAPRGRLIPAQDIGEFAGSLLAADPPLASGSIIDLDGGLKL